MKDWVILTLNKVVCLRMAKSENDLDIYYAVGNTNTQRQENELAAIIWNNAIMQGGSWSQQVLQ